MRLGVMLCIGLAACAATPRPGTSAPPSATASPTAAAPSPTNSPTLASAAVDCPHKSLVGVYHPYRLTVLSTCQWFRGTVEAVRLEKDGDHHVDITPDDGYGKFLNAGDQEHQQGGLLIEIMPGQKMALPSVGDHVAVFGTWVYDADHGWKELHPVWAIRYLDTGKIDAGLPPAVPLYNPDEGSTGSSGGGGLGGGTNCDSNYLVTGGPCLKAGIGDYDCYGGSGDGPNYTPAGATIKVVGNDEFGLDRDGDGYGCD
jgi:hypothetical protein